MSDIPVVSMLIRSGGVAKFILVLLAVFSFVTWAVIISRLFSLWIAGKKNRRYLRDFERVDSILDIGKIEGKHTDSPFGRIGLQAFKEYKRIIEDVKNHQSVGDWSFYLQNQFSMASEKLNSVSSGIVSKLDRKVFILAIVSSVAPFMGLLGTVWGIMNSFYQIGSKGSASLPVVAPGIAEALITTIVGLAVAIPSVFFYNIFIHRTERIAEEMEQLNDRLILLLKREMFSKLYGQGGR